MKQQRRPGGVLSDSGFEDVGQPVSGMNGTGAPYLLMCGCPGLLAAVLQMF